MATKVNTIEQKSRFRASGQYAGCGHYKYNYSCQRDYAHV